MKIDENIKATDPELNREKYEDILNTLTSIISSVKDNFKNNDVKKLLVIIQSIELKSLNSLTDSYNDIRNKIIFKIKEIYTEIWNTGNLHLTKEFIKIALEIKADNNIKRELFKDLNEVISFEQKGKVKGNEGKKIDKFISAIRNVLDTFFNKTEDFFICRWRLILRIILGFSPIIFIILLIAFSDSNNNKSKVSEEVKNSYLFKVSDNGLMEDQSISFADPYINAKVMIINMDLGEVDDLYYDLPDSLMAQNLDEVGTVIKVWRSEELVGRYEDGADALQNKCKYEIVDYKIKKVIYTSFLTGTMPPEVKRHHGKGTGSFPEYEMLEFVKNLPVKDY